MGTLTIFWYVIIGGIALAMGILWFILEKKIKEEEVENRVEPDLHDLFNDYIDETGEKKSEESAPSLHAEFDDHDAFVSLKEEEDFEPFKTPLSAPMSQSSSAEKNEPTHDNFSANPTLKETHQSSFSSMNEIDGEQAQPDVREVFGDYSQLDSQFKSAHEEFSLQEELSEQSIDASGNLNNSTEFASSMDQSSIDDHKDTNKNRPQKPIFESNKPSLMERVKGLFGKKKERPEMEMDDSALMVDPDTGEAIIRRPLAVKTVALILQAPADQPYHLDEVLEIAEQQQLMIGEDGFLMHLTTTHYGDEPTYSIAHLLHPGSFRAKGIEKMDLPGLLFFANIPGPDPEIDTIDYLVNIAATFGSALGGTLFDDQGEAVTEESLRKLYEEVNALDKAEWDRAISEYY